MCLDNARNECEHECEHDFTLFEFLSSLYAPLLMNLRTVEGLGKLIESLS